jgi:hypothetical protein
MISTREKFITFLTAQAGTLVFNVMLLATVLTGGPEWVRWTIVFIMQTLTFLLTQILILDNKNE